MPLRDRLNRWAKGDSDLEAAAERSLWGRIFVPGMILLSLVSFFAVGSLLDIESAQLQNWMAWAADNPMSLLVVIGIYFALSFLGTPQFLLFALTGAVLPPTQAFLYGWVATMVSSTGHFLLGRQFSGWIRSASGKRLRRMKQIISQNGIVASAVLRNMPAGPFIFVNLVCGASGMRGHHFLIGTGVGIIPKAAALIFLGVNLGKFLKEPSVEGLLIIGAVLVGVLAISAFLARFLSRFEKSKIQPN
ncbi:MAG: DedA family protein [Alphaproteobacteria bacterium]|nr:MAG: DedA family protein [Alphaproteobacteria bacterium]